MDTNISTPKRLCCPCYTLVMFISIMNLTIKIAKSSEDLEEKKSLQELRARLVMITMTTAGRLAALVQVIGKTLRQISSQLRNLDQRLAEVSSIRRLKKSLPMTFDLLDH